jgi:hypothetical protein
MAKAKLCSYLKSLHGRERNFIYYTIKGRQYVRAYAVTHNPRSAAQQKNRTSFAEAVRTWQELSPEQKNFYNMKAEKKPYSGYNLFISISMKSGSFPVLLNDKKDMIRDRYPFKASPGYINSVPLPYLSVIAAGCVYKPPLITGIQYIHDLIAA